MPINYPLEWNQLLIYVDMADVFSFLATFLLLIKTCYFPDTSENQWCSNGHHAFLTNSQVQHASESLYVLRLFVCVCNTSSKDHVSYVVC